MQLVGRECGRCGALINVDPEAVYCGACRKAFHRYCTRDGEACAVCGKDIRNDRHEADLSDLRHSNKSARRSRRKLSLSLLVAGLVVLGITAVVLKAFFEQARHTAFRSEWQKAIAAVQDLPLEQDRWDTKNTWDDELDRFTKVQEIVTLAIDHWESSPPKGTNTVISDAKEMLDDYGSYFHVMTAWKSSVVDELDEVQNEIANTDVRHAESKDLPKLEQHLHELGARSDSITRAGGLSERSKSLLQSSRDKLQSALDKRKALQRDFEAVNAGKF